MMSTQPDDVGAQSNRHTGDEKDGIPPDEDWVALKNRGRHRRKAIETDSDSQRGRPSKSKTRVQRQLGPSNNDDGMPSKQPPPGQTFRELRALQERTAANCDGPLRYDDDVIDRFFLTTKASILCITDFGHYFRRGDS